jgi:hypothetical protein
MPNTTVPAAGGAMSALLPILGMALLLTAAALRTRLGRLWISIRLFRLANALGGLAERLLHSVEKEGRQ